jgi:hypothetical protein
MRRGRIVWVAVLLVLCSPSDWQTEPFASVPEVDEGTVTVSTQFTLGGLYNNGYAVEDITVLFLDDDSDVIRTAELGTVTAANGSASVEIRFTSRESPPAAIVYQPGDVHNPENM